LQKQTLRQSGVGFRPWLEILGDRMVPSTLIVTNNLGFGPGSLSAEIGAAQSGDTIVFAPHIGSKIVVGTPANSGVTEIEIGNNLDIEGPGANKLAISGGGGSRVFVVDPGVQVRLSGLTIEDGVGATGAFDPGSDDGKGGGILNYGTLTVSDCTVSNNYDHGSGVFQLNIGGGIYNAGELTVSNSTVTGNTAGLGGGIYNSGALTMSGSTVTGNTAGYGGGIYNAGSLAVLYSTVFHNSATSDGADVFTEGPFTKSHSKIGDVAHH
jgi:hypothetical protein